MLQAVGVVLDHDDDDDDMNPNANGAVVINMGGHHPEDGMVEAGMIACHLLSVDCSNRIQSSSTCIETQCNSDMLNSKLQDKQAADSWFKPASTS